MGFSADRASDLAMRILLEMAERPEDVAGFLGTSGLQASELRNLAQRPDIALFLLDFIAEDDDRILRFSAALGLRPQDIMAARTALSGPGSYGWAAD
ncbi:DUF3572 family protein [Paracoccus aestuarii]|nr:DUF3572 family protein [Paracoccus aestuarii]WCQ98043.1 DUF3572 family protein [Paracoccus aestuarii]